MTGADYVSKLHVVLPILISHCRLNPLPIAHISIPPKDTWHRYRYISKGMEITRKLTIPVCINDSGSLAVSLTIWLVFEDFRKKKCNSIEWNNVSNNDYKNKKEQFLSWLKNDFFTL